MENEINQISENGEWEVPRQSLQMYDKIGSGNFGTVFYASWRLTKIAVKVLDKSETFSILEFRSELESLSQVRHPNIIQFFGACTSVQPFIILLEYMPRGNLEINNKNLSFNEKKQVLLDVCTGLAYLHNRHPRCIIHRDLKPNNILLNLEGHAKIADFGLSKYFQNETNEAYLLSGETGTIRYMAPEVFNNQIYNLKVDVYSLGLIIYYIYANEKPFNEYSVESMKTYFSQQDLILSTNKIKSKHVKSIINKCIDKNPKLRIDINELFSAWELFLSNSGKSRCIIF